MGKEKSCRHPGPFRHKRKKRGGWNIFLLLVGQRRKGGGEKRGKKGLRFLYSRLKAQIFGGKGGGCPASSPLQGKEGKKVRPFFPPSREQGLPKGGGGKGNLLIPLRPVARKKKGRRKGGGEGGSIYSPFPTSPQITHHPPPKENTPPPPPHSRRGGGKRKRTSFRLGWAP